MKFVSKDPIYNIPNIPALFKIMARRRPDAKPFSETMLVNLLTHICVTRPQWLKKWHIMWSCYLTSFPGIVIIMHAPDVHIWDNILVHYWHIFQIWMIWFSLPVWFCQLFMSCKMYLCDVNAVNVMKLWYVKHPINVVWSMTLLTRVLARHNSVRLGKLENTSWFKTISRLCSTCVSFVYFLFQKFCYVFFFLSNMVLES